MAVKAERRLSMRELENALREQGFRTRITQSGSYQMLSPTGAGTAFHDSTLSTDFERTYQTVMGRLYRIGFQHPDAIDRGADVSTETVERPASTNGEQTQVARVVMSQPVWETWRAIVENPGIDGNGIEKTTHFPNTTIRNHLSTLRTIKLIE